MGMCECAHEQWKNEAYGLFDGGKVGSEQNSWILEKHSRVQSSHSVTKTYDETNARYF